MTTHDFYTAKGGQGCTTSMVLEAATTQGRVLLVDATGTGDLWGVLGFNPGHPLDEQIHEIDDITFACSWKFGDQPVWRDTDFDEIFIDHGHQTVAGHNRWDELVLVTRNCYLALRRGVKSGIKPDRIVIVAEPGRSLGERDIHNVFQCNTINTIHVDPAIARSVDAGILYQRNRRKFA